MDQEINDFLFSVLGRYYEIPEDEKKRVKELVSLQSLNQNEFLIQMGKRWGQLGIVYNGVFKVSTLDLAGNEKIICFRQKGDITGIYMPYFVNSDKDPWFSIQALTKCTIINIPPDSYQLLMTRLSSYWQTIEKKIFFDRYLEMENRVRSLLIDDATTRYLNFQKDYPDLEQQISLFQIASYLGISPGSLSRIRAMMANDSKSYIPSHPLS